MVRTGVLEQSGRLTGRKIAIFQKMPFLAFGAVKQFNRRDPAVFLAFCFELSSGGCLKRCRVCLRMAVLADPVVLGKRGQVE